MRSAMCVVKGCGGMHRSYRGRGETGPETFAPCDKCGGIAMDSSPLVDSIDYGARAIIPRSAVESPCPHTLWSSPHVIVTALHSVFCHICRKRVIATPEQCRQWASGSNGIPPPGPSELPDSEYAEVGEHIHNPSPIIPSEQAKALNRARLAERVWTKEVGAKFKAELVRMIPPWVQFDEVMQSMGYVPEKTYEVVREQRDRLVERAERYQRALMLRGDELQACQDDNTKLHARISRLERELERKK